MFLSTLMGFIKKRDMGEGKKVFCITFVASSIFMWMFLMAVFSCID